MSKQIQEEKNDGIIFHPSKLFMYLFLASLTMIFLFLTLSYLYTRIEQNITPIKVPSIFMINTFILLGTSYFVHQANIAYIKDNTQKYQRSLLLTIFLTIIFMLLQIVGWNQLLENNASFFNATDNAKSYLQVISILHFIHIFVGLPFLVLFYLRAKKRMVEPVSVLIYFSDPSKKTHLNLLTLYWHFLDILWVYLVLFFWINSLF